jgi:hypothetical protein
VITVIEKIVGSNDISELTVSTPTAPGIVHHFTKLSDISDEISAARIYAGFHYRNSTVVGTEMGRQIGEYVLANAMQPLER